MPNAPIVASPFTTSSGIRASRSMSAPSTEVSQNSRIRAQNSSPRRAASASGRGCGWIRPSWKSPRYSCLPKLGFCHPDSLASSATWRASRSPTFRVCPVCWVLIAHPVSLGGLPPDTALHLPGGNTPSAHSVPALTAVNVNLAPQEGPCSHVHALELVRGCTTSALPPKRRTGSATAWMRPWPRNASPVASPPAGARSNVSHRGYPSGPGGCGSAWNRQACPLGIAGARGLVVEPDPALGEVAEVKCSARGNVDHGGRGPVSPLAERVRVGIPAVEVTHHRHGPHRFRGWQLERDLHGATAGRLRYLDQFRPFPPGASCAAKLVFLLVTPW